MVHRTLWMSCASVALQLMLLACGPNPQVELASIPPGSGDEILGAVEGVILDDRGAPLVGVPVVLDERYHGTTDEDGTFRVDSVLLEEVVGVVRVLGAKRPPEWDGRFYPNLQLLRSFVAADQTWVADQPIYLPALRKSVALSSLLDARGRAVDDFEFRPFAGDPLVGHLRLMLSAGADLEAIAADPVGLSGLSFDRLPIPLPRGLSAPLVVAFQPDAPSIDGWSLELPVDREIPEGTPLELWSWSKEVEQWQPSGKAQVRTSLETGAKSAHVVQGALRGFGFHLATCASTEIRGRVVDQHGRGVVSARVDVLAPATIQAERWAALVGTSVRTDGSGDYRISGVRACRFVVRARIEHGAGTLESVAQSEPFLSVGRETAVESVRLNLDQPQVPFSLVAHFHYPGGFPVEGLKVSLWSESSEQVEGFSTHLETNRVGQVEVLDARLVLGKRFIVSADLGSEAGQVIEIFSDVVPREPVALSFAMPVPSDPRLSSPPDRSTVLSLPVHLRWQSQNNTASSKLSIALDPRFADLVLVREGALRGSALIGLADADPILRSDVAYYWKVVETSNLGQQASRVFEFRLRP